MDSNKSTENLLDSDDNLAPVDPDRNHRIYKTLKNEYIESDESSSHHVVRPDQKSNEIPKASKSEKQCSEFMTTSYGVWDRKPINTSLKTAADVHHSNEPEKDTIRGPVPLPRRKIGQAAAIISSSPDTDDASPRQTIMDQVDNASSPEEADGTSTIFFSQSRQNTIVSQQEDKSSILSISPKIQQSTPHLRLNLQALSHSDKSSSSSFNSRELNLNDNIEPTIPYKVPLTWSSRKTTTLRKYSNQSLISKQSHDSSFSGHEISTSDRLPDSDNSSLTPASFRTLNEKKPPISTKYQGKGAPPKPARKVRSASNESPQGNNISNKYSYEKLIGIYIHESGALKFDYLLLMPPMIRVSLYDVVSGCLLLKSDPARSAVHHQEPKSVHFIQPLVSRGCTFKKSQLIECVWEELLLINDDIQCLQTGNEIVFFEVVSMANMAKMDFSNFDNTDGWHQICWAFLRSGDGTTYSHIDQRSCLQLFFYQTKGFLKRRKIPILEQWRMQRKKYPATLDVTLKGIKPTTGQQVSMKARPMHALEGDIQHEYDSNPSAHDLLESHVTNDIFPNEMHSVEEDSIAYLLGKDRKLPGETCKVPNQVHAVLHQPNTKGCLVSKFSPNGQQLALAIIPATSSQQHDIIIVQVPGLRKLALLQGHTAIVYSLVWSVANDELCYLLSVSSDRTAIVWGLNRGCVNLSLSIFPHPCFVYAGVILAGTRNEEELFAATGGRDGLLRVWRSSKNKPTELVQELQGHKTYITSIVSCRDSKKLYSSDESGCILEWSRKLLLFEKTRIVKLMYSNIRSLQLHRHEETILVSCATVTSINIRSGVQLHTFDSSNFSDQRTCFALSPCGSLLVTATASILQGWNLLTGQKHSSFTIPMHAPTNQKNYISSIDFHPHSFKLSITVYGENLNAGVMILENEQMRQQRTLSSPPIPQPTTIAAPKTPNDYSGLVKQQDLGKIIQRIDDIFRLPQNRTDDLKSQSTTKDKRTYVLDKNIQKNDMELHTLSNRLSTHTMILQRSATFSVGINEEHAINQTFSISGRRNAARNSETYNVGEVSDDHTTISETL